MYPPLKIVQAVGAEASSPPGSATLSDRIRQLREETRSLALEHIAQLRDALLKAQRISEEVALGGDVYPPGIRELASRLRDETCAKAQTLDAIMSRN